MKKRVLALMMSLTLAAGLLAGCGSGSDPAPAGGGGQKVRTGKGSGSREGAPEGHRA